MSKVCNLCGGSGIFVKNYPHDETCNLCGGTGHMDETDEPKLYPRIISSIRIDGGSYRVVQIEATTIRWEQEAGNDAMGNITWLPVDSKYVHLQIADQVALELMKYKFKDLK